MATEAMIRGIVTAEREALIRLAILGPRGRRVDIEAVIDTGFDGYLSLPRDLIAKLKLRWLQRGKAELADGGETTFDVFQATVLWDSRRRDILVDEANTVPLLGMSLLANFVLEVEAWSGGRVTIRRPR